MLDVPLQDRVPASELQGFIDQLGDENLSGMMRE